MLSIQTIPVTEFQQNSRLVTCERSGATFCLDPGGDVYKILEFANKRELTISEIWLTHSHLDHCGGVAELIQNTGARLIGHKAEAGFRSRVLEVCAMYGLAQGSMQNCPEPDLYVSGGETLTIGEQSFEVLFTPGHSPGHVCFYNKQVGVLLAGDTLFAGSIGRTDLPGGDTGVFMQTFQNVIMKLPDDTKVLPGHGPDTTIGVERVTNPFLRGV